MEKNFENRRSILFFIDICSVFAILVPLSLLMYGNVKAILVAAGFFLLFGVAISGLYATACHNKKIARDLFIGLVVSLVPIYITLYVYEVVAQSSSTVGTVLNQVLYISLFIALLISTFAVICRSKFLEDLAEGILLIGILLITGVLCIFTVIWLVINNGFDVLILQDLSLFKILALAIPSSYLMMLLLRNFYQNLKAQKCPINIAIIGTPKDIDKDLQQAIGILPYPEYTFIGFISPDQADKKNKKNNVLGNISNILVLCKVHKVNLLVNTAEASLPSSTLYTLCYNGVGMMYPLQVIEEVLQKIPLQYVSGQWFIENVQIHNRWVYKIHKRLMDVIISIIVMIVTFPLTGLIWFLNLLTSRGPLFYQQERMGSLDKPFAMHKFRSMVINAHKHKLGFEGVKDDPRVTFAGKFIRPLRLDELPQMINIVNGEISLVGPRPDIVQTVEKLRELIPFHSMRRLIIQGWTGWAQLNAGHADKLEDNRYKFEYDLYYLKHRSIFWDFHIFFKALFLVFCKGGF